MLKKLRNKKTNKKIWITLGILILPAFLFWGLGRIPTPKSSSHKYIGEIFGRKITFSEYKESINAVKNLILLQFPDREKIKDFNLEEQAWERIILLEEAKKRKIKVNDEEVIDFIQRIGLFKDKRGQFNHEIYLRILKSVFHSLPRDFEESIRKNLIILKLYSEVTKDTHVSEEEIKEEFRKQNEEITLESIGVLFSDLQNQISSTEEELKEYFSKNSLNFKLDLSFNLEYVILEDENKLKEFNEKIKKNKNFTEVSKEINLEIKETGPFTLQEGIPGLGWIPQIFAQLLKIKEGEILPPVLVDGKYYLLKLKTRKEPYIPDFEEIKEKVKTEFIREKTSAIAKEKMNLVYEKIKQTKSKEVNFQKLSEEFGLNYQKLGPFKYGGYLEKIGSSNEFWKATKDLKDNEISSLIFLPSGIFLTKLISRSYFDETKFAQEREKIKEEILSTKKENRFKKFLEELKKQTKLFY